MLGVFVRGLREDPAALSQVVMAANQPVLLQRSMVDGLPDEGILPSGQVAAAIDELLSCRDVIEGIAAEAERCLNSLLARRLPNCEPAPAIHLANTGETL
ncbi:hypothetical protein D3C72_2167450 [compost metagenome]